MLPPGHVAGGYLAASALLQLTHPNFSQEQTHILLWLGAFLGFCPDLDMFWAFAKVKSFTIQENKVSHREFFTHAPLLWLAVGLTVFFLAHDEITKYVGLLIWLGSWSHFVLDSIEYGVTWLWPFNSRLYALRDRGIKENIRAPGFWKFWGKFLRYYTTRVSFYLEIIVIISALIVYTHG